MRGILVTGATGFCASHLIRMLLEAGHPVTATDLPRMLGDAERLVNCRSIGLDLEHPQLTLQPADLLEPDSLAPLFEQPISHVFHTASLYSYSARLDVLRRVNVEGTRNLLALSGKAGLERFLHWSTCGVFGKPAALSSGKRCNLPFRESGSSPRNTPPEATAPEGARLVNAYSVSKWEQEKLVWAAAERGLPLTVIRPAPMYGPGSDYGHMGIILATARGWLRLIPADARNMITTSVHVEDVARFAVYASTQPDTLGEDYNVADNSIISSHEFLHYIALLVGRRMWDVPGIYLPMLRVATLTAAAVCDRAHRWLGLPRPKMLEVQSATYIGSNYWISNRKTLATGFEYRYPDVREGLKDSVTWLADIGRYR